MPQNCDIASLTNDEILNKIRFYSLFHSKRLTSFFNSNSSNDILDELVIEAKNRNLSLGGIFNDWRT